MTGDGVLFERTFWLNRHPLSRLFVALSPRRLIITQNAEECGNIANMAVQDRSNTEYNLQKCDVKKIQNRSNVEHRYKNVTTLPTIISLPCHSCHQLTSPVAEQKCNKIDTLQEFKNIAQKCRNAQNSKVIFTTECLLNYNMSFVLTSISKPRDWTKLPKMWQNWHIAGIYKYKPWKLLKFKVSFTPDYLLGFKW